MNIGTAYGIVKNIQSEKFSDDEKGEAIMEVCGMETINGITKDELLCALWWLLNLHYDVPADARPPRSWKE